MTSTIKRQSVRFVSGNTFESVFDLSRETDDAHGITLFNVGYSEDAPTASNRWFGLQWSNASGTYGTQIAFTFDTTFYIRRKSSGTWTSWRTI